MLNLINRHKGLSIVTGLALILLVIMFIIFISLFSSNGNDKYGTRLDGIEDVELTNLKEIKSSLEEKDEVTKATVRLQGKLVYIDFTVNSDVSVTTMKDIATSTLDSFSEEELEFYDISYIISWTTIETETVDEEEVEKEVKHSIQGTKHHLKDNISWSNN